MMGYGGFGYGMGMIGWVFGLILIAGVVLLVTSLSKPRFYRNHDSHGISKAKEIAAELYARGEISEEEYRKIRDNLHE